MENRLDRLGALGQEVLPIPTTIPGIVATISDLISSFFRVKTQLEREQIELEIARLRAQQEILYRERELEVPPIVERAPIPWAIIATVGAIGLAIILATRGGE